MKARTIERIAWGLLGSLALTLAAAAPVAGGIRTLVPTGESVPLAGGGSIRFQDLGNPYLNASGQVAFWGEASKEGVFRTDEDGSVVVVAQAFQALPRAEYYPLYFGISPRLNESGQTVFWAISDAWTGIFRGDADGSVHTIALTDDAAPGTGGGHFQDVGGYRLDASGQVAFRATASGGGYGAFLAERDGSVTAIARPGDPAPGTGGTFTSCGIGPINASGQMTFSATTDVQVFPDFGVNKSLFRAEADGSTTALIVSGEPAPGPEGGRFVWFHNATSNASGQTAFKGYTDVPSAGSTLTEGVFRLEADGSVTTIARDGDPAPGRGGGVFTSLVWPVFSAAGHGEVAFHGEAGKDTGLGAFRTDGAGTLVALARRGDVPPEGNGQFTNVYTYAMASGGAVMLTASLTGTTGGTADDRAYYLADDREMLLVVREGQALAESAVTGLSAWSELHGGCPVNDYGQVAFVAELANGREGIFLFSPDTLHWRDAIGGSWDSLTHWTLGLRPGGSADVFIEPTTGITVTGPAGSETVKSLTVGALTPGQTVHLALSSAGNLTSLGDVTVKSNGSVSVDGGTLAAGRLRIGCDTASAGAGAIQAAVLVGGDEGQATFDWSGGSVEVGELEIGHRGTMTVGSGGARTLQVTGLTIDSGGGVLDLTDNALVVDYGGTSPFSEIGGHLASGCNGGSWDGPGIASSAAAQDSRGLTALGVLDDGEKVIVDYCWAGDTNLDGVLDSNDYDKIDTAWILWTAEGIVPEGGFRWAVGDFNYDNMIDSNDYDLIDRVWTLSEGAPLGGVPAGAGTTVPTPEPATLLLLAAGATAALLRRRRPAHE